LLPRDSICAARRVRLTQPDADLCPLELELVLYLQAPHMMRLPEPDIAWYLLLRAAGGHISGPAVTHPLL
jgi:hypothetical protein